MTGAGLCIASPAFAEIGASISAYSEASLRGYSISGARPVAVFDLSYDDPSGAYLGGSASAVSTHGGGIEPFALQLSGGYARRLSPITTLDVGISHTRYSSYSSAESSESDTEVYAGIAHKYLSSRLYLSPHYFGRGVWTAYGEVNGSFSPAERLNLSAHLGMLVPVRNGDRNELSRKGYDWRLAAARELGPVSLQLALVGGGPGHNYYRDRFRARTRLIVGISCPL